MYYKSHVKGVARVSPELFAEDLDKAILKQLKKDYEGQVDSVLGRVLVILEVLDIGEGILIPGDGAAYYKVEFLAVHYVPELQELIEGSVKDIAKFGAFVDFGAFEGLVHISQTMDDFVSLDDKNHTLLGKDSNRLLKVGDKVRARIVAVSYKDPQDPKIGLTMRQSYLGALGWIEEMSKPKKAATKKKETVKGAKKK